MQIDSRILLQNKKPPTRVAFFFVRVITARCYKNCTAPKPPRGEGRCPEGAEGLSLPQSR